MSKQHTCQGRGHYQITGIIADSVVTRGFVTHLYFDYVMRQYSSQAEDVVTVLPVSAPHPNSSNITVVQLLLVQSEPQT